VREIAIVGNDPYIFGVSPRFFFHRRFLLADLAPLLRAVIETTPIMNAQGHTLFATAIGACGIAWNEHGVIGVQLPQAGEAQTAWRLASRFPATARAEPPPRIAAAIADIVALLTGEPVNLTDVVLDEEDLSAFDRAAYAVARRVPPGETITYGEIAARIGDPHAARAVGRSMGANPYPIIVPCHRVLGADGKMGGFSAAGGIVTKAKLLSIERARIDTSPLLFEDLPIAVRPPSSGAKRRPPYNV
jgi:methylated-DNA-[protein]-cysteine S-methyltransferase